MNTLNNISGAFIKPDGWIDGELLTADTDTYTDDGWKGCDYRLPSNGGDLAVNITPTGKLHYTESYSRFDYKLRVKIEFVGDCEASSFHKGWLHITKEMQGF